jgi:thioesterase domain-containing protein
MKAPAPKRKRAAFGTDYLQARIASEFALARHLGVVVETADDDGVVLSAPLPANANGKGTAFGGSLFSVAVLTGWAWVARYLDAAGLAADAVIQESTIQYFAPVRGVLRARLRPPAAPQVEKFAKMLQRAGRGRIRLRVDIHQGAVLAARFEGVYAAAVR